MLGGAAVVCALLVCSAACRNDPQPQRLPTADIEIAGRTIPVEVARTNEQRGFGMKYRKRLGADEGMLFVFGRNRTLSFFMKDTYSPLNIAFLRSDGAIINIEHMQPLTLTSHTSRLACRLALEMPQGWFRKNGVKEGDRIGLPEDLDGE